jgi:CheY-like chemotaxis protein
LKTTCANPADCLQVETKADKPDTVLIVEDERDHALLVKDVFQSSSHPCLIRLVQSGEEAIAYLSGEGKFADRTAHPFPALMLLDLRMHGIGGFGVLRWLQGQPALRQKLTVVVLSVTESSREIDVVYELGAQSFWPKADFNTLSERVRALQMSWLNSNCRGPISAV